MSPKITYLFGWTSFLGVSAFLAWRFTHHIGAALLTFLWLTVPAALFARREIKKRTVPAKSKTEIPS
jgi:thiol:disulfide interchange protein